MQVLLGIVFAVVLGAVSEAAAGGTLIVKYTPAVDACAATTFARGRPFASVASGDSLDALHAKLSVVEIRSLFIARAGLDARQAAAAWRTRVERATARNPRRAARTGGRLPAQIPDLSRVYRLRYAADLSAEEAAALYAADPLVEYAHPDYPPRLAFDPNDPYFYTANSWNHHYGTLDDLWNLKVINAPAAWEVTRGEGVVIAVVDTGVDRAHPEMAANIWSNPGEIPGNGSDDDGNGFIDDTWGWDFQGDDNNPVDSHGHGTHVAGIAAAVADNSLGIAGVAPDAEIMSVRIFAGDDDGIAGPQAILYAALNGADVINNSWGLRAVPGTGSALDDAVDTALALGSVVVFAGANGDFVLSPVPWWRHPRAINVARAYPPLGQTAFSASDVDIAAPGQEILSLRGGSGMNGPEVGADYVVASGTSMAAPHVAGAAALLLFADPALTPSEVKWHLEAAAVQWGAIGWESLPWNPMSGWGVLDLTHAFDPLAVTTRLDRHNLLERHEHVSRTSRPSRIAHAFTTHDPIDWTTSAPAWLQAVPSLGSGDGVVELTIDTNAAGIGVHSGDYQVVAAASADGGATLPLRLYGYPDHSLADRTEVFNQDRLGLSPNFGVTGLTASASPTHAVLAWNSLQDFATTAAVLDGHGTLIGTQMLSTGRSGQYISSAFDGRRFALLWIEHEGVKPQLLLSRLAPDGSLLDAPRAIASSSRWWQEPRIAFDGRRYVIVWTEVHDGDSRMLMLRMGADFAVEKKPVVLYHGRIGGPRRNAGKVELACGSGQCLAVWADSVGPSATGVTRALRLVNGEPEGGPFDVAVNEGMLEPQVAASAAGYLVVVDDRRVGPCGPTRESECTKGVLGVRVDTTGTVLDTPVELITAPSDTPMSVEIGRIGFNGVNYVLPYALSNECFRGCDSAVFVTRVALDGNILDQDGPRPTRLVDPSRDQQPTLSASAATADALAVTWTGFPRDPLSRIATSLSLDTRPVATDAVLPERALGAIGTVSLSEGERFAVRLLAPQLPSSRSFSAAGLPDGATLDAVGGALHWTPAPNQAGTYMGIRLMADAGPEHVEETVTITVSNQRSSLSGIARQSDGTPVGGVAVYATGSGYKRTTMTEPDGSFAFFDVEPKSYRLKVGRASKRTWRARPITVTLAAPGGDIAGLVLEVSPR